MHPEETVPPFEMHPRAVVPPNKIISGGTLNFLSPLLLPNSFSHELYSPFFCHDLSLDGSNWEVVLRCRDCHLRIHLKHRGIHPIETQLRRGRGYVNKTNYTQPKRWTRRTHFKCRFSPSRVYFKWRDSSSVLPLPIQNVKFYLLRKYWLWLHIWPLIRWQNPANKNEF